MTKESTLNQVINDLVQKREKLMDKMKELGVEVKEIDVALQVLQRQYKIEELSPSSESQDIFSKKNSTSNQSALFESEKVNATSFNIDRTLPLEEQIIKAFEYKSKFVKLKPFAKWFVDTVRPTRTEGGIVSLVRKMKVEGKPFVKIRFKANDANTYWGLSPWLEDQNKIAKGRFPDSKKLSESNSFEIM